MITLPDWAWLTAFLGCFLFGGMVAAVLLFALFGREERDTIKSPPPVHVPEIWPRDDEQTHTKVSAR